MNRRRRFNAWITAQHNLSRGFITRGAAKSLNQTWAGTFLILVLFFGAALLIGGVGILILERAFDPTPTSPLFSVGMLITAAVCIWGIWRLARR